MLRAPHVVLKVYMPTVWRDLELVNNCSYKNKYAAMENDRPIGIDGCGIVACKRALNAIPLLEERDCSRWPP